jgi:tripartite-type tricarboxylate transporter receptor subunit TctC
MKRLALLLFLICLSGTGNSQSWPTKPVKFIVPAGQGGTIDPLSRFFADAYGKIFGQTFVIENRPGAQGKLGIASFWY